MKFSLGKKKPLVSVIIISYNMEREIPRTVHSFLQGYQLGVVEDDIEVLVMDNGSDMPISPNIVKSWPKNVRYIRVKDAKSSPAFALNEGVKLSRAEIVCPVIDGARMVTPSVLSYAISLMKTHACPVVATVGYHLGYVKQQLAVKSGYNQQVEDELLRSIDWPNDPYKLFEISSVGGSAQHAWLGSVNESNVVFVKKSFYKALGGYDERFDIAGGGLVNLDFFKRCVESRESQYILLAGEGSFHQYHGGVTTSRSVQEVSECDETRTTWQIYVSQYEKLRGCAYERPTELPMVYGMLRPEMRKEVLKIVSAML